MAARQSSGKAFIKTLRALREIFDRDYPEGGWLPSGRGMCESLGVSYVTYCKALNRLVHEGFAESYPKKGHYVLPSYLRCHKIGLIFESGLNPPFIGECRIVAAIIDTLAKHCYSAQILREANFNALYESALSVGVDGLIWVDPPEEAHAMIEAIDQESEFPMVVIRITTRGTPGKGCVGYDASRAEQEYTRFVASQGHSRVIYVGRDYETASARGLINIFQEAGLETHPELFIENPQTTPGLITDLITNTDVTAILSEGNIHKVAQLFTELTALADDIRPEVLVQGFPHLPNLYEHFPKVKPIPTPGKVVPNLGTAAAEMLINHLRHGDELTCIELAVSYSNDSPD